MSARKVNSNLERQKIISSSKFLHVHEISDWNNLQINSSLYQHAYFEFCKQKQEVSVQIFYIAMVQSSELCIREASYFTETD